MNKNPAMLNWLLEEENPGVRLRALTGLCGLPDGDPEVEATRRLVLKSSMIEDVSWKEWKIHGPVYRLTALAEIGLRQGDGGVGPVADEYFSRPYDANCDDLMAMRALTMLGYAKDGRYQERLERVQETQLSDGGWLCLHRLSKAKRAMKSCIKAAMHGLLLAGELRKKGLCLEGEEALLEYFRKRRLFYRTDDQTRLVLESQPGKRMTDIFFPNEAMRVGLPQLLESLAALGVSKLPEFSDAWALLDSKRDAGGKLILEGTLPKSYLPKEHVGKPSKWATLYASMAERSRDSKLP
jgi:hypothetical protein